MKYLHKFNSLADFDSVYYDDGRQVVTAFTVTGGEDISGNTTDAYNGRYEMVKDFGVVEDNIKNFSIEQISLFKKGDTLVAYSSLFNELVNVSFEMGIYSPSLTEDADYNTVKTVFEIPGPGVITFGTPPIADNTLNGQETAFLGGKYKKPWVSYVKNKPVRAFVGVIRDIGSDLIDENTTFEFVEEVDEITQIR